MKLELDPQPVVVADQNSRIWGHDSTFYAEFDSWTDRGERSVIHQIADEVRGRPILDVGVGAGRSTWLVGLLSEDYIAVDYAPEMVELARQSRPGTRVQLADARNLSEFSNDRFALVFFSHAGIDSLDHDGRAQALREFNRVLAPGGLLVYSTLNRNGEFYKCGPGPVGKRGRRPGAYQVARFLARFALRPVEHIRGFANVRAMRSKFEDHGDWAIDTMPTHEWSLLVHYVTPGQIRSETDSAGLELVALVSREGEQLELQEPASTSAWFHVVARKPL